MSRLRSLRSARTAALALVLGLAAVAVPAGPARALEVGQKAPDFTLPSADGKPVKLSELTAKGPVVLYTFIQAFTGA
jgi:peroxiredoxin Q/BCP